MRRIMKQKKTKTDYLRDHSVFLFIVHKLHPFEKPFHKLGLRVSSGFPNPDETLALVYEILHNLRKETIQYSKVKAKKRTEIMNLIENKLKVAEAQLAEIPTIANLNELEKLED